MIKAVLFDFDETLQDRTEAFEHYMDAFFALPVTAAMWIASSGINC